MLPSSWLPVSSPSCQRSYSISVSVLTFDTPPLQHEVIICWLCETNIKPYPGNHISADELQFVLASKCQHLKTVSEERAKTASLPITVPRLISILIALSLECFALRNNRADFRKKVKMKGRRKEQSQYIQQSRGNGLQNSFLQIFILLHVHDSYAAIYLY